MDSPESQQAGHTAHLPDFSGARGVPQSRPGSGQPDGRSQNSRDDGLAV